jgi:hypothetical protein
MILGLPWIYLSLQNFKKNYILNTIRQGVYRLFKIDLAQLETAYRFLK